MRISVRSEQSLSTLSLAGFTPVYINLLSCFKALCKSALIPISAEKIFLN